MESQRAKRMKRGAGVAAVLSLGGVALATATAVANDGAGHAWATLENVDGDTVGFAKFTEDATGTMHVNVHASGMSPGLHGIHVHGVGSCGSSIGAFSDADSHHNPGERPHGAHAGDLPNFTVNGAGRGRLNATLEHFTLADDAAILDANGSALVVHAKPDDFRSQPTGDSGARIACGVIHSG